MHKKDALEDFLERHEPIAGSASIATGTVLSGWRIVAFLGRGGSAEVYRVVHLSLPLQGALKLLIRNEASHIERFKRETELLAKLRHPAFPHFLGSGEVEGRPYIIMELLEPMELPHDDKAVAKFLMSVAEGVKALHSRGIIHRDIKPQNIMRRADGSPVIIDLGLAKRYSPLSRLKMPATLSVVDGKRVGLGTPRYAAPEQFSGGEISPAADIHALGMLADECFGGKAPLCWMRIIRRCSSSIPFLRYQLADDFITAVRRRHWMRNLLLSGLVLVVFALVAVFAVPHLAVIEESSLPVVVEEPQPLPVVEEAVPLPIVEEPLLPIVQKSKPLPVAKYRPAPMVDLGQDEATSRWRSLGENVSTNGVKVTIVRLNNANNIFAYPIYLLRDRECWIEGPGVLDADLFAPTGTVIRLKNCVFINRTHASLDDSKIQYVLEGGVRMDFTYIDKLEASVENAYIETMPGTVNEISYQGTGK